MNRHWRSALSVLWVCGCAQVCAADARPVVFQHVLGPRTVRDDQVRAHFAPRYTVISVDERKHAYRGPRPVAAAERAPSASTAGSCLTGSALIFYVVSADGTVTSPFAAEFTEAAVAQAAMQRVGQKRYEPAQIDGKPVATVAVAQVVLGCPVDLRAIVGLWNLADGSRWVEIAANGAAIQCRRNRDGSLRVSHGRFDPPYYLKWQKPAETEQLEYSAETLITHAKGSAFTHRRAQRPMPPECQGAAGTSGSSRREGWAESR